jgi:V8-like Glu-specific endopeptidase
MSPEGHKQNTEEKTLKDDNDKLPFEINAAVVGPDDRKPVTNTRIYPWRCICWLRFNDGREGTGSLVTKPGGRRPVVLTAAHLFYDYNMENKSLYDYRGQNIEIIPGGSSGSYGSCLSNQFWIDERHIQNVQKRSETGKTDPFLYYNDYALIILPEDASFIKANIGSFGLAASDSIQDIMGLSPCLAGYAGDKGNSLWYEEGMAERKIDKEKSDKDQHLIYYTLDANEGDSGSPLFYPTAPTPGQWCYIIGVHTVGWYDKTGKVGQYNTATRITRDIKSKIYSIIT